MANCAHCRVENAAAAATKRAEETAAATKRAGETAAATKRAEETVAATKRAEEKVGSAKWDDLVLQCDNEERQEVQFQDRIRQLDIEVREIRSAVAAKMDLSSLRQ